jgi:hypothetical protein
MLMLLAGCAQPPAPVAPAAPEKPVELPALPATFVNEPDCPGCLGVTLTLRPDGSYLVRDQLGASEFYDFGRWRYADGTLELAGDRDARRYRLAAFRKRPEVERLRGPFRMVGLYDGSTFKECRTGLGWALSATRAAETLHINFQKQQGKPVLVALDAQFEGAPETLRVLRPATLLKGTVCPG